METQQLVDGFNAVLEDSHKAGVSLDDPIDRAMIVSTIIRLIELELECAEVHSLRNHEKKLRRALLW